MNRPILVTPPAILPVSLAEAKLHLRLDADVTLEDTLVTGLIAAATDHLDGWTGILGRCLVEQEWRQDFEAFAPCLPLPLGPVIEIVTALSGAAAIDPGGYALKVDAGGRSFIVFDGASVDGPVAITYKAGYATMPEVPADGEVAAIPARTTVPAAIKTAIMLLVGAWYENREETAIGVSVAGLPSSVAVNALLAPYRRVGI